ncbi:DUF5996 family protein [Methanolobus profundi]|uniref:Ava_C0101 and related proteins n=1 Tax=Methanolobus profundi TaxID=487685 RepID=A0A1I4PNJ1_9EURY|nr:DUF5996 family protein [Methanolobus profundi]SFM29023.1 hypothetical protein SAMN04488696_0768 [Methanolobus profundi]
MNNSYQEEQFPVLPIEEWEDTMNTFHLFLQVIGKIRLKLFPKRNHWWHVTLYISTRGITTGPIPYEDMSFEMEFDLIEHVLIIRTSTDQNRNIELKGLSVSQFYKKVFSELSDIGISTKIVAVPYDTPFSTEPFETDDKHSSYNEKYVNRYWRILVQMNSIFETYRGTFTGKCSPSQFFWHHKDLSLIFYSGRSVELWEGANPVDTEAYSHELIAFGFWPGDENVREPAFYASVYPEPEGLTDEPLSPEKAFWSPDGGGMALLMYNDARSTPDPKQAIVEFMESVYQAGAKKANWDKKAFQLPV